MVGCTDYLPRPSRRRPQVQQPGGRIHVRAGADEAWVVLVVGNTVPTIPPERQEHVFERFTCGSGEQTFRGKALASRARRRVLAR